MTQQFASIELARLYESQGYLEDALAMYKTLDAEGALDAEGGQGEEVEIRAAITRLETSVADRDKSASETGELDIEKLIADVNGPASDDEPESDPGLDIELAPSLTSPQGVVPETDPEKHLSRLLEKWVMLMVAQRRVRAFKTIREKV